MAEVTGGCDKNHKVYLGRSVMSVTGLRAIPHC